MLRLEYVAAPRTGSWAALGAFSCVFPVGSFPSFPGGMGHLGASPMTMVMLRWVEPRQRHSMYICTYQSDVMPCRSYVQDITCTGQSAEYQLLAVEVWRETGDAVNSTSFEEPSSPSLDIQR
jgi:hypothetical protein